MEGKKKSWMGKYRIATSTLLGLIELGYILGITAVLFMNDGDCNTPLRLWLEVFLIIFAIHFVLLSASEILMPHCSNFLSGLVCIFSASFNAFLGLFTVVWFFLGNYWYYSANNQCSDDFYEGQLATCVILIIYYVFLGTACCMGCLLLILISLGSGITNRAADY